MRLTDITCASLTGGNGVGTVWLARLSAVVVFLFMAGLWFTEAIINGPNSHTKLTLAAPTIGYSSTASHVASHVDWPSRTLMTVRPALQDAVYLRRMTTTYSTGSPSLDLADNIVSNRFSRRIC